MIKRIVLTIITIIWMFFIFMSSNQKAEQSTDKSHSFIMNTIVNIYKVFDGNASDEKIESIVENLDYPVRKLAHFTEYFILGILIFFTLRTYSIKNIYIMIALCFVYACSDEFHQLFILGRDGNLIDVTIDSIGSTFAILIFNKLKEEK